MPQGASPAPVPAPQVGDSGSSDSDNDYRDARLQQSDDAIGTSAAQTPAASSQIPPNGNRSGASKSRGSNLRPSQSAVLAPGVMQRVAIGAGISETVRDRYNIPNGWAWQSDSALRKTRLLWDDTNKTEMGWFERFKDKYIYVFAQDLPYKEDVYRNDPIEYLRAIVASQRSRVNDDSDDRNFEARRVLLEACEAMDDRMKPSRVLKILVARELYNLEKDTEHSTETLCELRDINEKIRRIYMKSSQWKTDKEGINKKHPPWVLNGRLWRLCRSRKGTAFLLGTLLEIMLKENVAGVLEFAGVSKYLYPTMLPRALLGAITGNDLTSTGAEAVNAPLELVLIAFGVIAFVVQVVQFGFVRRQR